MSKSKAKSKPLPYLIQGKNIILVIDGKSHTISKDTHMNYGKIKEALKTQQWDELRELVEPAKAIVNFGTGYVTIDNGKVFWKGNTFNNALANRMIEMYQDGFPIDPMVRFMENLMNNPSKRSVDQVYGFLEKNNLPITEDGHFLAFKKVRKVGNRYMDIHSGTIENNIGAVIEMDRNLVDDNPESHCSVGLHFCSETYLGSFGNHSDPVMILKINPGDVVSIPTDYNGAKGRCCKYEVVAEVNGDVKSAFARVVDTEYAVPKVKLEPVEKWGAKLDITATETWPKAKAKSVPKVGPQSAWPFPISKAPSTPYSSNSTKQLYDAVRVRGGNVEYSGLTLVEANARVEAHVRQKKAVLKVVKAGTDEEV